MIRSDKRLFNLIPIGLVLASVLFVIALFVFSFMAHEAVLEREDLFDARVFNFLHDHVSGGGIAVLKRLTFFGSHWFLFPAYVILILVYYFRRHKVAAVDIAIIGFTSMVLLFTLKHFFHRARPDMPLFKAVAGYSFPSGHALSSFIFCAVLIHLIRKGNWRRWIKWSVGIFLLLFSIGIGISRIVLRVHYPTDVVAGFCMGFAWVTLLFTLQEKLWKTMVENDVHDPTSRQYLR